MGYEVVPATGNFFYSHSLHDVQQRAVHAHRRVGHLHGQRRHHDLTPAGPSAGTPASINSTAAATGSAVSARTVGDDVTVHLRLDGRQLRSPQRRWQTATAKRGRHRRPLGQDPVRDPERLHDDQRLPGRSGLRRRTTTASINYLFYTLNDCCEARWPDGMVEVEHRHGREPPRSTSSPAASTTSRTPTSWFVRKFATTGLRPNRLSTRRLQQHDVRHRRGGYVLSLRSGLSRSSRTATLKTNC